MITLHQFILLFNSINHVIPIRYLSGSFLCLQILLGPAFAYNGLDEFVHNVYKMKVSETEYFSYTIPAVLCFILGLHYYSGRLKGEVLNQEAIRRFLLDRSYLPKLLIIAGFVASFLSGMFSSELAFVLYLVGSFKFVGLFLMVFSDRKFPFGYILLVVGSIILSSLGTGMFHDLLTWFLMLAVIFSVKYPLTQSKKIIAATAFTVVAFTIQISKTEYRSATWSRGEAGGVDTFIESVEKNNSGSSLFDKSNLAQHNIRINQGFIITNIMQTVPHKIPYENGKELQLILESALLPRILAPSKLEAGDQAIFMKYTGMRLARNTSMALSPIGDSYINFGVVGGCFFMFLLGLFFNQVLKFLARGSVRFPILLLFVPLIFIYPIRPDCELQTSLGHLFKACFLIFAVMFIWKRHFSLQTKKFANRLSFN